MLYAQSAGLVKTFLYPLKLSSSLAQSQSHAGKAKSYKPQYRALNETMLPMR